MRQQCRLCGSVNEKDYPLPGTFTSLRIHFIWSTKNRKLLIDEAFEARLYEIVGGILRKRNHALLVAGGTADHIHLLVKLHPTQSISDVARDVKSNSSAWVRQEFPSHRHFEWQSGYGAFSVSRSSESKVYEYIQNQKQHHLKQSFQDEFQMVLKRHEIEYDERYLWD